MNDNLISIASYIGYLFGGYCGAVGAYVVLRWGVAGVTMIASRKREIDEDVEKDLRIRIGR